MHLSEDVLQMYLDRETSEQESEQIRQHLEACATCRENFSQVQQRLESNRLRLDSLNPEIVPDAHALLSRIQTQHLNDAIPKRSHWRSVLAAGIAVAALTTAFYFQPVRVWAAEFLSLFRIQQVTVLRFDPANLQQLNRGLY
ncbi:MAG TPA: zf-HC2 domain-containing protein, partial [Acidobacteriota bacterium]